MFCTPVLFIIFNRPDTAQKVFDNIKRIKPKQLFVAADGPRVSRKDDKEKCLATREIIRQVDWECEVKTLFRDENLGCRIAVSTSISWFFSFVSEGIILEDDCVPSESFFPFCAELLQYYRNDKRVMMISGDNFVLQTQNSEYSYFFSKYHFIWGWATWKRAWELYDVNMEDWPNVKNNHAFLDQFSNNFERQYWLKIMNLTYQGVINTWDYQWAFSIWKNNGLTICPGTNLISNIGFDENATHTIFKGKVSNLAACDIHFPLKHPPFCYRNTTLDKMSFNNFFKKPHIFKRIQNKFLLISRKIQSKNSF
jgi:hypothetical protein